MGRKPSATGLRDRRNPLQLAIHDWAASEQKGQSARIIGREKALCQPNVAQGWPVTILTGS